VTVAVARSFPDPRNATKMYTTTWFDMWRIMDGKADEHWDYGTIAAPAAPPVPAPGVTRTPPAGQ
jgi:predicted SnoaL-like aldol condensation-catalyzing enzyme